MCSIFGKAIQVFLTILIVTDISFVTYGYILHSNYGYGNKNVDLIRAIGNTELISDLVIEVFTFIYG